MAILAFPTIQPNSTIWSLESNTQRFVSPLSKSVQTLELPGARWKAVLQFKNLDEDDLRVMAGFMAQLRGQSGRFRLHDHSLPAPRGVATGVPLVKGASQSGTSLITDGWTFNITNIMRAGDYIAYEEELHMVVVDVNSDGGGAAVLTIEPPIRTSPLDNAVIDLTNPTAVMRLDDDSSGWRTTNALFSSFTLSAVETFT